MIKPYHTLNDLRGRRRPVLLAIGFFDGMHRGHQRVIRRALAASRQGLGQTWVMTFDPHPRKVLFPASAPALLTSTPHKLRLLKSMGVAGCLLVPFTPAYAQRKPKTFISSLTRAIPALSHIFIGQNWTFGRHGCGNAALLKMIARDYGFKVVAIPPVCWRNKPISSTRIRRAVAAGRLADAARMLGRPFSVLGTVVPGRQLGRKLGVRTANMDIHNEVRPPHGVYAVVAAINGKHYPGVANLGVRPTIANGARSAPILELHVFDLRRNLYGKTIEVFLLKRLRGERKFASRKALRIRIQRDITEARQWLQHRNRGRKSGP